MNQNLKSSLLTGAAVMTLVFVTACGNQERSSESEPTAENSTATQAEPAMQAEASAESVSVASGPIRGEPKANEFWWPGNLEPFTASPE